MSRERKGKTRTSTSTSRRLRNNEKTKVGLNKKNFDCMVGLKATTKWMEVVKRHTEKVRCRDHNREFRSRVDNFKHFKRKPLKKGPKR